MCGEEVGGDASLSRERDVMWTWKSWKSLTNENAGKADGAACTATCTHLMELECFVKTWGKGDGRSRL